MRHRRMLGITLATALLMGGALVGVAQANHTVVLSLEISPDSPTIEGTLLTFSGEVDGGHQQVDRGSVEVRRYGVEADCEADTYPPTDGDFVGEDEDLPDEEDNVTSYELEDADDPDAGTYWYRAFYHQADQGHEHPNPGESDCVEHEVLQVGPDLTATKTNDTVDDEVLLGDSFEWEIEVENIGNEEAEFANADVILVDDLPADANYTAPVVDDSGITGGDVDCEIVADTLTCEADGAVTIDEGESFTVAFDVEPTAGGSLDNPAAEGDCMVDPDNVVAETDETNNDCDDSVQVLEEVCFGPAPTAWAAWLLKTYAADSGNGPPNNKQHKKSTDNEVNYVQRIAEAMNAGDFDLFKDGDGNWPMDDDGRADLAEAVQQRLVLEGAGHVGDDYDPTEGPENECVVL